MGNRRSVVTWAIVAIALALAGIVVALLAASAVAANDEHRSRQQFETTSADVASTISLDLRHEQDLVVNASAFALLNPGVTTSQLRNWIDKTDVFNRYPEVEGVYVVSLVTADELATHIASVSSDPPDGFDARAGFQLTPPGERAVYCLQSAGVRRPGVTMTVPVGADLCAGKADTLTRFRDQGETQVGTVAVDGATWLAGTSPLYASGRVPQSVDERRVQLRGLLGTLVRPDVLLHSRLASHADIAATLEFRYAETSATFRAGDIPVHADTDQIDLGGGWRLSTMRAAPPTGLVDDANARNLVVAGCIASVLLAALLFALATGRSRAIERVRRATEAVRFQALHDPLTRLANRSLLADRAEQLLARSQRAGVELAVLYIDLDGFKTVNDTRGHEVGDQLLRAVATRLAGAVRGSDTVARMGGDEFVVLLDGAGAEAEPLEVANRLLDLLRHRYDLDGDGPLCISASIGVAVGTPTSPDELIRSADRALYEAKAAGRNRSVLFGAPTATRPHPVREEIAHR